MNRVLYIIGSGPSINDITEKEWKYIENNKNIGIGLSVFTHKRFKFYLAYEGEETNKIILDTLKSDGYINTLPLIAVRRQKSIIYALKLGFKVIPIIARCAYFMPSRKPWFLDEEKPPHPFKECRAHNFDQPLFRFRGSLSAAINSALILGANEIRLVGIDLNSQEDFWEDINRWSKNEKEKDILKKELEIKKQALEARYSNRMKGIDSNKIHTTAVPYLLKEFNYRPLRGMPDVLQWMDKQIREEGMEGIFITSKKSLLYKQNKLEYKDII